MSITKEELETLSNLADAATPGVREWGRVGFCGHVDSAERTLFVTPVRAKNDLKQVDADCTFVSYCTPDRIKRLVERVTELKEALSYCHDELVDHFNRSDPKCPQCKIVIKNAWEVLK